ncbi:hypothetical protein HKCCE3408_16805 [Rhodobacterales bacterium HKCCE3408]|nr:hypothetical protein [Rhodobacterales bacterium HKCCE3408]
MTIDRRTFLTASAAALAAPGIARAVDGGTVMLRDLYNRDMSFSDLAEGLAGQRIDVQGFMAPPLRADAAFFVLTRRPMATCPFCESEADWPADIVAVYTQRTLDVEPFNVPLVANGRLELGSYTDPEFGFLSRVRLIDAVYDRA